MEYLKMLKELEADCRPSAVENLVAKARALAERNQNPEVYRQCFACLDLTSLRETDNEDSIATFARKAAQCATSFSNIPEVASLCVYPIFVDAAGLALGDSNIAVTSVAGGFPASQTYLEVKMLELAMSLENGADEVDVVMSVGQFLSGNYEAMASELQMLRDEAGEDTTLKVIIESGVLREPALIRRASLLVMEAGADFVKTSTGKTAVSATPEAAAVMCVAISDFYRKTGRKVGFKAAGGISSPADAVLYYSIVQSILGEEWLNPSLFRIGASSLANNLLSELEGRPITYF